MRVVGKVHQKSKMSTLNEKSNESGNWNEEETFWQSVAKGNVHRLYIVQSVQSKVAYSKQKKIKKDRPAKRLRSN